jgi:GT2 family glycosyltransferase
VPVLCVPNVSEDLQLSGMRIAVLVTVHNRVNTTVRGLSKLASLTAGLFEDFQFSVFLVDDGSTDGTSSHVRELPLDISIARGTGSLYWNRGMALAYQNARGSGRDFDAYMLYNDDVLLDDNFGDFLRQFRDLDNSILVGAFREPANGEISYSGFVRVGRMRPFAFLTAELTGTLVPVDTFNGNVVLIPAKVFETLGGLDPAYTHAYGDIDLGLRAKAIGVQSYVYGSPIGFCERGNSLDERIRAADPRGRWKLLFGYPHGPGSHLRFARKHGIALFFPIYAVGETARRAAKLLGRRATPTVSRR